MNVQIGIVELTLKTHKIHFVKDFKCKICCYMCKTETTLRNQINTKDQLDTEELNAVIQNYSDKKELIKGKYHIKELEERVEHLTLSKTKVECEVAKLRAERDSQASLLSLCQSIDNPVPEKQPQKKN